MGKNDVNFKISADSGDAQRGWLEVIGVLKQTQNEIARMGNTLERSANRGAKAMKKQITALQALHKSFNLLRNANAIIGGIRTAMSLVTGEIEAAKEAVKSLQEPRKSYEQAKVELLANVPAAEYDAVIARIEKYKGAIDRAVIAEAVSTSGSTVGLGITKVDVAQAVIDTARLNPQFAAKPENLKEVAMAAIQLYNTDKSLQNEGAPNFSRALEFLQVAQMKSAQASPEAFGKFVVPAAMQLMRKYGYTKEQAFAEQAATQTLLAERSGRMGSRTSLIQAEQISEIGAQYGVGLKADGTFDVPGIRKWMREGKSDKARKARMGLLGAFDPLFDAEIAGGIAAAGGSLKGSAKFKSEFRDLILGKGDATRLYQGAVEGLSEEAVRGEMAAKQQKMWNDPGLSTIQRSWAISAFAGQTQEIPMPDLSADQYHELMDKYYARLGMSGWDVSLMNFSNDITPGSYKRLFAETVEAQVGGLWGNKERALDKMTIEDVKARGLPSNQEALAIDLLQAWHDMFTGGMPVRNVDDNGAVPSPSPAEDLSE